MSVSLWANSAPCVASDRPLRYKLRGLTAHSGADNAGHWVAYTRLQAGAGFVRLSDSKQPKRSDVYTHTEMQAKCGGPEVRRGGDLCYTLCYERY